MRRNLVAWAALVFSVAALVGGRNFTAAVPVLQEVPVEGQKVAQALSDAFNAVANSAAPSVVQINVVQRSPGFRIQRDRNRQMPGLPDMPEEDMKDFQKQMEEMLKRFFNQGAPSERPGMPFQRPQDEGDANVGTGTGFIYDKEGRILTNAHVVADADKIVVTLQDGSEAVAKVIGTHPETDVAIIQVTHDGLVPMKIGNSNNLKVGQWVLAMGSPFGLDHTLTAGIISATERQNLGINRFESFIQTDAAINLGNSGGPLMDLNGKVVGINSAIATPSRSNAGVGFAIPINMAVRIADKLIKDGKITPALMGINIDSVTPALARQLGIPGDTKGLLITEVGKASPAEKAGLKVGDIVLSYDESPVFTRQNLQYLVSTSDIGKAYKVVYLRDGKKEEANVSPAAADSVAALMDRSTERPGAGAGETSGVELADFGFSVAPLSKELAEKYEWPEDAKGIVVTDVKEDGPAQQNGLEIGDRITQVIRDKKVTRVQAVKDLQDASKGAGELAVYVEDVRKRLPPQFMTLSRGEAEKSEKPAPAATPENGQVDR